MTIHPGKSAISLCLLASFLLLQKVAYAASITDDINNLAETAKSTADSFLQESFDLRLKYQYNGCALNGPDRKNLYSLAAKACDELRTIAKVQQSLKNKIETYQGTDWDDKYGKTGLWRKLASDLYITTLYSCIADYYRATTSEPDEKNKILLDILTKIDPLDKALNLPDIKLLKAKATAQLARTELAYKPSAIYLLNSLSADRDIPEPIRVRAAIEKINFLGSTEDDYVSKLLNELDTSSCRDDLELVLSLAFFQQQKDAAAFEKIVQKWPQAQDYLAPIILDNVLNKLINDQDITAISTFDAELAVLAAWKNNAQNYAQLLDKLTPVKKFQTALILYVAGLAFAENAPEKSINLLTQASKLQQSHKSSRLDIEPEKIAEQAAKLAYNLFLSDASACLATIEAFQNYSAIAADKADIQLEYLYTLVLNQCGQPQQAMVLLQKIASGSETGHAEIWRKRAAFDLILRTLSQTANEETARKSTIEQLALLIDDCPSDGSEFAQLKTEAVTIYCQLLLENNDAASAQKILDTLRYSQPNQPTLTLLKSKALLQLDKLCESAKVLLDVNDPNYTGFYNHAMELLEQTTKKIDLLQTREPNFQQTIQTCEKLSRLCYIRLRDTQKYQAGLYLAEITIFSGENHQEKISQASKLLSDLEKTNSQNLDLVRCRARLLAEQGRFEQAARLWAKIAVDESDTSRWWQAKFFELDYAAKAKKISKKDIAQSIEVLQASSHSIPDFWAEKLKLLRQQCTADINNS
jgi:hypothetical protein